MKKLYEAVASIMKDERKGERVDVKDVAGHFTITGTLKGMRQWTVRCWVTKRLLRLAELCWPGKWKVELGIAAPNLVEDGETQSDSHAEQHLAVMGNALQKRRLVDIHLPPATLRAAGGFGTLVVESFTNEPIEGLQFIHVVIPYNDVATATLLGIHVDNLPDKKHWSEQVQVRRISQPLFDRVPPSGPVLEAVNKIVWTDPDGTQWIKVKSVEGCLPGGG